MAVVFVEDLTADGCVACAPSSFFAAEVIDRVTETHPPGEGREWRPIRQDAMPEGQSNPCPCKHMMFRRHWHLSR